MEDMLIIGTIVGFVLVITAIFKHFDSKFDIKIDKINKDISDIGKTVEAHAVRMGYIDVLLIGPESRKSMVSNYKERTTKEDTGNPISPEEKQRLIEKLAVS